MRKNFDFNSLMYKQIFGKEQRSPDKKLPQEKPDWDRWSTLSDLSYIWLGHSTILLKMNGLNIIFDPVFVNAAPIPFVIPRFQPPVVRLNELPPIDIVVISHDHYDHLSREAIRFFSTTDTTFYVPLGVSSYLLGWGVNSEAITELDWWDEVDDRDILFACTPAQHFSGRLGPNGNQTLWASWVIRSKDQAIFFSGDSGYDIHFAQIGEKYGPFDVTFMENGQYNDMWPMTHLFPKETVQAHRDLNGGKLQPIHWGMFSLSTHSWNEPIQQMLQFAEEQGQSVLVPKIGSIVAPKKTVILEEWWHFPE